MADGALLREYLIFFFFLAKLCVFLCLPYILFIQETRYVTYLNDYRVSQSTLKKNVTKHNDIAGAKDDVLTNSNFILADCSRLGMPFCRKRQPSVIITRNNNQNTILFFNEYIRY